MQHRPATDTGGPDPALAALDPALAALDRATAALWGAVTPADGLEAIAAATVELTGADACTVHLCDGPSRRCHLAARRGLDDSLAAALETLTEHDELPHGRAMRRRQPVDTALAPADDGPGDTDDTGEADDPGDPGEAARFTAAARDAGFVRLVCEPVLDHGNVPIGLLSYYFRSGGPTAPAAAGRAEAFAVYRRLVHAYVARARVEQQLQRQNESLSLTLDASSGGTWSIDVAGMQVDLDGRSRSPFRPGPPGTDLLHDVLQWVPDDDRGEILARLGSMMRDPGNDHTELEFRAAQPDGSTRWLHGVARAERDGTGAVVRISGIVLDITERKQRELEAVASSTKLEAALAAMSDAVFILDLDGNFLHVNDAFVRFCRFQNRDELLVGLNRKPPIMEMQVADGWRLTSDHLGTGAAMQGEVGTNIEYTLRRNDTGESWIGSFNFAPIRDTDGNIMGSVVTGRDITERKRTERLLVEREARLSSIIDTAAEGIVVIDELGTIESVNQAAVDLFGYPAAELVGRNVNVLMPLDDHDDKLAHYRETGERRVIGVGRQVDGRHRDGSAVPVDLSVAEWYDGEGRRFFTGLLRDISERRRTEEALLLARRLEAVGRLAAGVAHDFNNLLTVIGGNLELVEGRTSDPRTRRLLRRALDAVEVGASFNRKLLSLAQRRKLEPRPVVLGDQVQDVAGLLERTLGERIELVTACDEEQWTIEADPGEIDSALLNLVMNARDALPDGGRIEVRVTNETVGATVGDGELRPGEYVCLTVSDSGTGMEPEVLARALEPFFTTKEAGAGSGLGLSSVATFARQSDGALTLDSRPGAGTTVRLFLPRSDAAAPLEVAAPLETTGRGEPVLVVEDDDALREMTLDRIESIGYSAVGVRSAAEAIEWLGSDPSIRAVLTDIVMAGGMNGFELAQWIATHHPHLRVILSSGYSEQARPADDAGLLERTPYLPKPYSRRVLAETLAAVLDTDG